MAYLTNVNNAALGNGGAGNPGTWDIITPGSHDLGGRIVAAFMNIDDSNGAFTEMEEEIGKESVAVNAKYLNYTYTQGFIFEGRYTKLTPITGTFKVWFLK